MKKYIITGEQIDQLNDIADCHDLRVLRKLAANLKPIEPISDEELEPIAKELWIYPRKFARSIEAHITGDKS